jgi:hypothetical protein
MQLQLGVAHRNGQDMKALVLFVTIAASMASAAVVLAQEPLPPAKPIPPARVGFQMALRTGYSIPMGKVSNEPNDAMSDSFGSEVPFLVDIGAKVIPNLFVGGYVGIGLGISVGALRDRCEESNATCLGSDLRLGAQVQYHILPQGNANPWFGYGIGFELISVSVKPNGQPAGTIASSEDGTVEASGFEFAHLMAGVDVRMSRGFGLGPFLDLSLGQYSHMKVDVPRWPAEDRDIPDKAMHQWLALGLRCVFFP